MNMHTMPFRSILIIPIFCLFASQLHSLSPRSGFRPKPPANISQALASLAIEEQLLKATEHMSPKNTERFGRALQSIQNNTATELDLRDCEIKDEAAKLLAQKLQSNSSIVSLFLSNNQISDSGAEALAETLKSNTTLINLSLWNNPIGDDGAIAIAQALPSNMALQRLNLKSQQITEQGKAALQKALKWNYHIELLLLEASSSEITAFLQRNDQISKEGLKGQTMKAFVTDLKATAADNDEYAQQVLKHSPWPLGIEEETALDLPKPLVQADYHQHPKTPPANTPLSPNPIIKQRYSLDPQQKNSFQLAPPVLREALQTILVSLVQEKFVSKELQIHLCKHEIALASYMPSLAYYDQDNSRIVVDEQILNFPTRFQAYGFNQEQLQALLRQVLLHELLQALGFGSAKEKHYLVIWELYLYNTFFKTRGLENLHNALDTLYKQNVLLQAVQGQDEVLNWTSTIKTVWVHQTFYNLKQEDLDSLISSTEQKSGIALLVSSPKQQAISSLINSIQQNIFVSQSA